MEDLPRNLDSLKAMPLHTITEVYGEPGLFERFNLELDRFSPEDRELIEDARDLALALHANDRRAREPYNNHILRVATRIISPVHYDVNDPEVVIAALLHDSVEDHKHELAQLDPEAFGSERTVALGVISALYGDRVKMIVEAVTNPEFDKDGDWQALYREHVESSLRQIPDSRPVKLSDFDDNGTGIMYSPPDKAEKVAPKYDPMVPTLKEIVVLPDTPLSEEVKVRILAQLDLAEKRLAAVVG
jgi:(p)ppGpp synthase/HD superfamily hydrolase